MRTYYLFCIKKKAYQKTKDKPKMLFILLKNMSKVKLNNYSYGLSLYKILCNNIQVNYLANYLNYRFYITNNKRKYLFINKRLNEKTILIIRNSCIIIHTNVNFPNILNVLNIYDRRFFVVDFENKDYFWLNSYHKSFV